jgi:predicted  nucleic acid-binding Zn-ribbon protein
MEEAFIALNEKIEKAIEELSRLRSEIEARDSQLEASGQKIAFLESQVKNFEQERGSVASNYESRLAACSEQINAVIKKLDNVI